MKLHLEATQQELTERGDDLLEGLAKALDEHAPDLAKALRKAQPEHNGVELRHKALRELKGSVAHRYRRQMDMMNAEIAALFEEETS